MVMDEAATDIGAKDFGVKNLEWRHDHDVFRENHKVGAFAHFDAPNLDKESGEQLGPKRAQWRRPRPMTLPLQCADPQCQV